MNNDIESTVNFTNNNSEKDSVSLALSASTVHLNQPLATNRNKFLTWRYYKNNSSYFLFLFFYIALQVLALLLQLEYYKLRVNKAVLVARTFGVLIDFNMSLTILLTLRHIVTWLRNMKVIRHIFPFDHFLEIHKFIGVYLLILSIGHTVAHCINLYWASQEYYIKHLSVNATINESHPFYVDLLFTTASGVGWVHQWAMPTGWIALGLIIVIDCFSSSYFRKQGHFEIFHYMHWLFLPFYIVTIIHCTNFWKWCLGPGILLILEYLVRNIYMFAYSSHGDTYIKQVNLLPSRVTHLIIKRPRRFKFRAGDYVFIKVPKISIHEWHPFTISSAPELEDEIWLHVRSLGNWTNKLNDHFSEYKKQSNMQRNEVKYETKFKTFLQKLCGQNKKAEDMMDNMSISTEVQVESMKPENKIQNTLTLNRITDVYYKIKLDGPYGTPSSEAFKAEHAVLIASGIGVTPFAAILQSLWYKYARFKRTCPKCTHTWYDKFKEKKLKQVDFIWVNREYKSFEWFIELIAQIELQQAKAGVDPFIKFRLYNTSADDMIDKKILKSQLDIESSSDESRQEIEEKLNDLLQSVNRGRPNIDQIFSEIKREKKGDVHVLFCGTDTFGSIIQKHCYRYRFQFSKEQF